MMNSTRTRPRFRAAIAGGLLAAMALAGCSRSEPEQPPTDTNMVEDTGVTETEAAPAPVETAPVEAPPPAPAVVEPPREAPVAPDAQMQDDADATGMTSRVTRDEAPAENEADPQP
ncbi:MAG TPA: hypothetical protein VNJ10_07045 [Sphingomonas sp.]|nr:hypothetical protein [Sphingomonas sp.]